MVELEMSIEAYMMRTLMVENFVDILEACIQRSSLIDIVLMASEEPIIRDNVSNFSDVEQQHDVHEHREPNNQNSSVIAHNIVHLVKTNPSIEIKTLIASMLQWFGYTVSYKKAWTTKQKALEIPFGSWEQSYNYLLVWMTTAQHFVLDTIIRYKNSSSMEDGEDESPRVGGTFLTRKYCGTLLTTIEQDGGRNNFPLTFAIVENETKKGWMWFLHYLRRYVTPQPHLCIILDRRTSLLATLQSK
ncbi:hypothetical protein HKD37_10G027796 [Glycine soja]